MILQDKDAREGYFETKNAIIDRYIRVIGPTAFTILSTFKRYCAGREEQVFTNMKQDDWAEYIGISLQTFKTHLRILKKYNFIQVIAPKGQARLSHQPYKYILNSIDDIIIKEKDYPTPLSDENHFNDQFYNPEGGIFRKVASPEYIKNIQSGVSQKSIVQYKRTVNSKKTVKDLKDISLKEKNTNSFDSGDNQTSETKKVAGSVKRIYSRFSENLKETVSSVNKITLGTRTHQWPTHFRKLNEIDQVPIPRIWEVLYWYADHIGEEFVPECFSAESFRTKFNKLESAMTRQEPKTRSRTSPGNGTKVKPKKYAGTETEEVETDKDGNLIYSKTGLPFSL
jgi:hypothetical protein